MEHEILERPPAGYYFSMVMRVENRKWDWVALMVEDILPGVMLASRRECWVRVPGKHRSYEMARDVAEAMVATKH